VASSSAAGASGSRRPVHVGRVEHRQAVPGGRGERDGRHQLGIVADARTVRGVGPGPVEDELAVAVGLEVEGHGADEAVVFAREHDPRLAAGALAHAVRGFQRGQEPVLEEWVVLAGQPIPIGGGHGRDAVDDLQLDDARA